jgi:hypothetical protein
MVAMLLILQARIAVGVVRLIVAVFQQLAVSRLQRLLSVHPSKAQWQKNGLCAFIATVAF